MQPLQPSTSESKNSPSLKENKQEDKSMSESEKAESEYVEANDV